MKITLSEKSYLIFAKFLIIGLVAIFILGRGKHWPFTYWSLYDRGNPYRPKTVSQTELRILDTNQNWHSLFVKDLYTIDDDSSAQPGGYNLIADTFYKRPHNWEIYQASLLDYLEKKLNIKIEAIEVYKLSWELDYDKHPPMDIEKPSKQEQISIIYSKTNPLKSKP